MLRVIVESATNIPKTKFGKPDPIVSVIFKDEKKKTKKVDNELNPVWNEILEFDLRGIPLDSSSSLVIVVKDFETIGQNKLIGTATVSLKDLIGDQNRSLPYKQTSLLNEKGQDTGATIDLVIGYTPPSAPHPNDPSGTSVPGMGEEEEEDQGEGSPSTPTMNSYFYKFMINLLQTFSSERKLLEARGPFIIRQLCLLLNAENIFHSMADILLREEDLKFASTMVHTLNTILLTSTELFQLRNQLKDLQTPVLPLTQH